MRIAAVVVLLTLAVALAADLPLAQPQEVAARLAAKSQAPAIFQVGPNLLYRGKHIPGSIYGGMGARPDGIETLKSVVAKLPRDREIVIYCGCCPWDKCPNIKPAFDALKQMGFTRVKAMYVPHNFATDWVDKGYPVELGSAAR
jgi:rhodanese-related sulfurtransferase